MSAILTPPVKACACSADELAWCARWMQDHGTPDEWDLAAEAEYVKAHDALWAGGVR